MMKYIEELKEKELAGKKVLLRGDLDVPAAGNKIREPFRIIAQKQTLDYLVNCGAKVLLVAHISAIDSFLPIAEAVGELLGHVLTVVPHNELRTVGGLFVASPVLLLDNIRQDAREETNGDTLAVELAKGFDYYVNNAFAVSHRQHASVSAITKHLPSYAGLQIKKEIERLTRALEAPAAGKVLVLGGAKIATKLPVIKNFIGKAEKILIGGAIANNFFKANGIKIGASVVDDSVATGLTSSQDVRLPGDILITDDKSGQGTVCESKVRNIEDKELVVDIGPETAQDFAEIILNSELVIWNGPMGLSEVTAFANGTAKIAQAVAAAKYSIIGGGDTIAAVDKLGLLAEFDFVSTGGGAMLSFLAGEKLPGLEALGYYN